MSIDASWARIQDVGKGENYAEKKIFVLGTASFVAELRKNGLHVTEVCEENIDCVVVAYDSELNYGKLTEVCKVLFTQDVPFYGTNPDLRCPIEIGRASCRERV